MRYLIAKQHKRGSRQVWGVFDNVNKGFVEGGFFAKAAARYAAEQWNKEAVHAVFNRDGRVVPVTVPE